MGVASLRLSLWIRNGNRNPQHAIADRQSNFQACAIDHSAISPLTINDLRLREHLEDANCVRPRNVLQSLTRFSSIAAAPTARWAKWPSTRHSCGTDTLETALKSAYSTVC